MYKLLVSRCKIQGVLKENKGRSVDSVDILVAVDIVVVVVVAVVAPRTTSRSIYKIRPPTVNEVDYFCWRDDVHV